MIKLPFCIFPENMGAQYHHYFFGIILQKEENWNFIFNNYMGMLVKHFHNSHGDFAFDGIYSCDSKMMRQLIIRGPVQNFKDTVIQCLNKGAYVIVNVNEQNLPFRQAYQNHYFRHDLLIYGYDDEKELFVTAGFDENMEFCERCYRYSVVEHAYRTMQNEWDFEFFAFRWNNFYVEEVDEGKIKQELKAYLHGDNRNELDLSEFLDNSADTYYVNNSYKEYYGIQLYDYLTDRLKGQHKLFLKGRSDENVGVNDMRTINALRAHLWIVSEWLKSTESEEKEKKLEELKKLDQELCGIKVLLLKYVNNPSRKSAMKVVNGIKKVKEKEREVLDRLVY